jgi:uncharacterized membrane protein YhiD involved in acid resistance
VTGLTTAACIFVTAIIGLAVGAGLIHVSILLTAVVLAVLISSYFIPKKK